MSNSTIYFRALVSCMQNAYIFFFTLGIYFVYIPWNLERLQLAETDLGLWLFIFGPAIVGYTAKYLGLTFNMYALCVIWGFTGFCLIYLMRKKN